MDDTAQRRPIAELYGEKGSLSPEQRIVILEELRKVVGSSAFHSSKRCQEFLSHIVERAGEGRHDLLKERTIGVEVFHRGPAYEPNSDAIVRVRATEVRKRLAQYYDHEGVSATLRIELPPGSYVPEFRRVEQAASSIQETVERAPHRLKLAAVAVSSIMLLALSVWMLSQPKPSLVEAFWKPDLASLKPVLICLRQPVVYHLSRRAHESYLKTLPKGQFPSPYVLPLKAGDINVSDIVPVPDQYVTVGSAQVAFRLNALFASHNKPAMIRVGSDFSFIDLKESPTVLVGAVPHEWTSKLTGKLPFVMVQEGTRRGIREQDGARRTWFVDALMENGSTTEDYAVVTRVFLSNTPEPLVALAGVTQYGSDAASEFVTQENELAQALKQAPADWPHRNLQILLHLDVIGKTPGKPEVIGTRFW